MSTNLGYFTATVQHPLHQSLQVINHILATQPRRSNHFQRTISIVILNANRVWICIHQDLATSMEQPTSQAMCKSNWPASSLALAWVAFNEQSNLTASRIHFDYHLGMALHQDHQWQFLHLHCQMEAGSPEFVSFRGYFWLVVEQDLKHMLWCTTCNYHVKRVWSITIRDDTRRCS